MMDLISLICKNRWPEASMKAKSYQKQKSRNKTQRNRKKRHFTKEDIEEVRLVFHLVKERGMTLKGAQQKIKQNRSDVIHEDKIVSRLKQIRNMLLEIKDEL